MVIVVVSIVSISLDQKKVESHKKLCENKDFCNIVMSSDNTKILEFNQYKKTDKAPFIIYADPECLIEKIDGCKNNPEKSYTTKAHEHTPSGFQCLQYHHLKAQKTSIIYTELNIV